MDCVFCKIVNGEIPFEKVFETDELVAFNDVNPKAKIHILIIPKKHVESVKHLEESDRNLIGNIMMAAQKIADQKSMQGYKLLVNVGREGGQTVDHLHLHLLSGDANI